MDLDLHLLGHLDLLVERSDMAGSQSQRRLETLLRHLKGGNGDIVLPNPAASHASSTAPAPSAPNTRQRYHYTIDSTCDGVLSAEQRLFYEKNGYVVIPGLISQDKLERFKERFRQICSGEVTAPGLIVMRDVAIAKSEFQAGERAITKIQDFQVSDAD